MPRLKALYKYELKKLTVFIFALILFLILFASIYSGYVTREVTSVLSPYKGYYSIYFCVFEPNFIFLYSAIVFILAYIQTKEGFNKLWHSLPFTNSNIIISKIVTGIIIISVFSLAVGAIMLYYYSITADIYRDVLMTLNIDPAAINMYMIFEVVITIFTVYVFIYLFTLLIIYITGNSLSGVIFSVLIIHMPILVISAFHMENILPWKLVFLFFPHYFCSDNNLYYNFSEYNDISVFSSVFDKFSPESIIYYIILSVIVLLILYKRAVSPKLTEQTGAFSDKRTAFIFKSVFTFDFFMAGLVFSDLYDTFTRLLIAFVFALIGFIAAHTIVRKQGVSK